jgi:uncharacterized protein
MNTLMTLPSHWQGMSAAFIEGALFAANANPKPMEPEVWLPVLMNGGGDSAVVMVDDADKMPILNHFEMQYRRVKAGEYQLPERLIWLQDGSHQSALREFAQGFLAVWEFIEPNWQQQTVSDGTMRMLSALLTQIGSGAQAINPFKEIGRNDPCLCESGKKFKKCCGKTL